jgi:hypothetical protein
VPSDAPRGRERDDRWSPERRADSGGRAERRDDGRGPRDTGRGSRPSRPAKAPVDPLFVEPYQPTVEVAAMPAGEDGQPIVPAASRGQPPRKVAFLLGGKPPRAA